MNSYESVRTFKGKHTSITHLCPTARFDFRLTRHKPCKIETIISSSGIRVDASSSPEGSDEWDDL